MGDCVHMPSEIKTFVLYFLFIAIPFAGVLLYIALLTIEHIKESGRYDLRKAMLGAEPPDSAATNGEMDREIREIKQNLAEQEKLSGMGDREIDAKQAVVAAVDPDKLGRLVSNIVNE